MATLLSVSDTLKAAEPNYLDVINTVHKDINKSINQPVIIAVVDDGVQINRPEISRYLWNNPGEKKLNHRDDDFNEEIDDFYGWDISDHDRDVNPPAHRLDEFYHGTHLTSIMVRIVDRVLGDSGPDYVSIMPVKVLSDGAQLTSIRDGYKGIDYAVDMGADIILCAWSGGIPSDFDKSIIQKAKKNNVLIIAAAGNFREEKGLYPAIDDSVLAVSAIDNKGNKLPAANFGSFVDIAAPGEDIAGFDTTNWDADREMNGTSPASAMVAATAAMIKALHPEYTTDQVKACLLNSTSSHIKLAPDHTMRLGSGVLNVDQALSGLTLLPDQLKTDVERSRGYLFFSAAAPASSLLESRAEQKGIYFSLPGIQEEALSGLFTFTSDLDQKGVE